jgi:hypothetical protein
LPTNVNPLVEKQLRSPLHASSATYKASETPYPPLHESDPTQLDIPIVVFVGVSEQERGPSQDLLEIRVCPDTL